MVGAVSSWYVSGRASDVRLMLECPEPLRDPAVGRSTRRTPTPDLRIKDEPISGIEGDHARQPRGRCCLSTIDLEEDPMNLDIRLAWRTLIRRPLFSGAVILTLALGLGANATIFTLVDSLLLRSLPYPQAERLVAVWATVQRDAARPDEVERRAFSLPDLADLEAQVDGFVHLAGYTGASYRLEGERPERIVGTIADAQYLPALGIAPAVGVNITDDPVAEDGLPGILVSHGMARRRFGGSAEALGETLRLDGDPTQIVGVLPQGFRGLVDESEVLVPMGAVPQRLRENRGARWVEAVGRLDEGVELERVRSEMDVLFAALETEYAGSNSGYGAAARPLQTELVGEVRSSVLFLWGAVAAVLLIAAANVVNLLVAQRRRRSGDEAVFRALGATSWQSLRRPMIEAGLLGLLGGAVGLGLALATLRWLRPMSPVDLPGLFDLGLGWRAASFGLALAVVVGLAVGAFSALRGFGGRTAPTESLRDRRSTGRGALNSSLLIAEVALATVLTIGAGVLAKNFWNLRTMDTGLTQSEVGFLRLDFAEGHEAAELPAVRASLVEAAAAYPGVEVAALASRTPFGGGDSAFLLSPQALIGNPDLPYRGATRAYRHLVGPGYFKALGIPLLRGRVFDSRDALPPDDESSGPDAPGVAVVTADFSRRVFPEQDAIGQIFYLGTPAESEEQSARRPWFEIVGVVGDHSQRNLIPDVNSTEDPDVFFALEQFNSSSAHLVVATRGPAEPVVAGLQEELQATDPDLLAFAPATLGGRLAEQSARARFSGLLMALFAGLALVLAAVGIYGVVATAVAERRREIGIRMALGADAARVLREVASPSAIRVIVGLAIGIMLALVSARVLQSQVFETEVRDPLIYGSSALLLGVAGLLAAVLPARRASRIEASTALRAD